VGRVVRLFNLIITVSVLSIVPLIAAFLFPQRYWQSGLTLRNRGIADLEERAGLEERGAKV
jgi:ABC-type maltose transport system permease subunit